MCKLLSVIDIRSHKAALNFVNACIPHMVERDQDGLGVMRLGERGLSIQRWLDPTNAPRRKGLPGGLARYEQLIPESYNEEGTIPQCPSAWGAHARYATCEVALQNVHPFVRDGVALMHNGVISNSEEFENTLSSCDSEALLTRYIEAKVPESLSNLNEALRPITGQYACIVFNEKGYVDIFKDAATSLFIASVHNVGTVFCTSDAIIREACKKLEITKPSVFAMKPFMALRWRPTVSPEIVRIETPAARIDYQRDLPGMDCQQPEYDRLSVGI